MTLGPNEFVGGGQRRDSVGHKEFVVVTPDQALASGDLRAAGTVYDDTGREKFAVYNPPWLRAIQAFDVRDYGAVGDNVTDDTAAIQLAIDAAGAAGGGEVYFPNITGQATTTYLLTTPTNNGGISSALYIGAHDDITLTGEEGVTVSFNHDAMGGFYICGGLKQHSIATVGASANVWQYAATTYLATGTSVAKGARTITFATSADANNFTAGDDIVMRTGQCINNPNTPIRDTEPDAEYLRVLSVAAPTITLQWPTRKSYVQEYQAQIGSRSFTGGKSGSTLTVAAVASGSPVDLNVDDRNGFNAGDTVAVGPANFEICVVNIDPTPGLNQIEVTSLANNHAIGDTVYALYNNVAITATNTSITMNKTDNLVIGDRLKLGSPSGTQEIVTITGITSSTVVAVTACANSYANHLPIAVAAKFGVANVNNRTVRNVRFHNLKLKKRGYSVTGRAMFSPRGGVVNLEIDHCDVDTDHHFIDSSQSSQINVHHNRIQMRKPPSGTTRAWWCVGDTTGTDVHYNNNTIIAEERNTGAHVHEGVLGMICHDNVVLMPSGMGTDIALIDAYGRAYECKFYNEQYHGGATTSAVFVDDLCPVGGLTVERSVYIDSTATQISVYSPVRVEPTFNTGLAPTRRLVPSQLPVSVYILEGWLDVATGQTTTTLGVLPGRANILQVVCRCTTAFNAGTTNAVSIGTSGTPTQITAATAVTLGDVALTPTANTYYRSSSPTESLKAFYTQTGGAATAGKAWIGVLYCVGEERP